MTMIQMPFSSTGWPQITMAGPKVMCRKGEEHRLYHIIGRKCPCGPIPLVVGEPDVECVLNVFADNIRVTKGEEVTLDLKEMLQRIKDLEAKIEELSKKE